MLRSLDEKGKPKSKKDMSKDELAYLERAERDASNHRIKVAMSKKAREDMIKSLGV